ncbi:MAG: NAD-dependent epimerase/dehydratase family protein [Ignavibacteriae bacterium]|nr:NAD-dependent epimerase/dehydratase family protein [Ignavibacteriota bacterium]
MSTVAELDERQSRPPEALIAMMRRLDGDMLVLGAGGKMGPTLARMARRASDAAGTRRTVIAVSRFTDAAARENLAAHGVETRTCDLLDDTQLAALPGAPNIIYLAGRKFGASGDPALTWAMNTLLPARVLAAFPRSRIIVLSTGNVYPFSPADGPGSRESDATGPVGEYAQSCLGRERMVEYHARRNGTQAAIIRLNYAVDLRYGVLLDIATRVAHGEAVELGMGYVNVIWQADANAAALLALEHASVPPAVFNVTGPAVLSVRALAARFATLFGTVPRYAGIESETALLSDATLFHDTFPFPKMSLDTMCRLVAHWISIGGEVWNKPTRFEQRGGIF